MSGEKKRKNEKEDASQANQKKKLNTHNYCFDFNKEEGCAKDICMRTHSCLECGSTGHPKMRCPSLGSVCDLSVSIDRPFFILRLESSGKNELLVKVIEYVREKVSDFCSIPEWGIYSGWFFIVPKENTSIASSSSSSSSLSPSSSSWLDRFLKWYWDNSFLRRVIQNEAIVHSCIPLEQFDPAKLLRSHQASGQGEGVKERPVYRVRAVPASMRMTFDVLGDEPDISFCPKHFSEWFCVVKHHQHVYYGFWPRSYLDKSMERCMSVKRGGGENPTRATFKIQEALDRFPSNHLALDKTRSRAIDVGASPGGWSQYLSKHVKEVVAVDPADLKIPHGEGTNIRHLRMLGQQAAKYLLDNDEVNTANNKFDLLVCDINKAYFEAALVVHEVESLLRSDGGLVIFTLKLFGRRRKRSSDAVIEKKFLPAFRQLFPNFSSVQFKALISNGYEKTLYAVKTSELDEPTRQSNKKQYIQRYADQLPDNLEA